MASVRQVDHRRCHAQWRLGLAAGDVELHEHTLPDPLPASDPLKKGWRQPSLRVGCGCVFGCVFAQQLYYSPRPNRGRKAAAARASKVQ